MLILTLILFLFGDVDVISTSYGDFPVEGGRITIEGKKVDVGYPYKEITIDGETIVLRSRYGKLISVTEDNGRVVIAYYKQLGSRFIRYR